MSSKDSKHRRRNRELSGSRDGKCKEGALRKTEQKTVPGTGPEDKANPSAVSPEERVEEAERKWVTAESTGLNWRAGKKQPENAGAAYPDTSHIWVTFCIVLSR